MNSTLYINIAESWAASTVHIKAVDKPAPKLSRPAIWRSQDKHMFYTWGGRTAHGKDKDITKSTMWRFTGDVEGGGSWSSEIPNDTDELEELALPQRGACTTVNNTGYYFGGAAIPQSDPGLDVQMQPIPGMISFDMESKKFDNESTPDISPYGTVVGATAELIPGYGIDGLIMVLGGYGYTLAAGSRDVQHTRRFDNLTLYDPASEEWYWQVSTGEIPAPRLDHCSVGVKSTSDTYEM